MARPKGSPNRSSMRVDMTCQIRGFLPIDALIDAAELSMKKFVAEIDRETANKISPLESKAVEYLKLYVNIASKVASFIHPQKKAIDHTYASPLEGMSTQQKLDAMKEAVKLLELQTNGKEQSISKANKDHAD